MQFLCSYWKGWKTKNDDIEEHTCGFKPWFEEKIIGCGLTIGGHTGELVKEQYADDHHVFDNEYHILNACHGLDSIWHGTTYGGKLWKAKSVSDPELKKLVALLAALYDE